MTGIDLHTQDLDGRAAAAETMAVHDALIQAGVVTHVKKDRVTFFPPLLIDERDVDFAVHAFERAFEQL